ncbi:hypothetical protein CNEO3_260005 [Clostridium neonatale]|nr:hypothetical protein CNEO2_280023 [Clostridium neonatale]CAI3597042.1 hypothetical protein CNEO3_30040 [Clostridium neonatale]CAI3602001.1 hypothetical protein CNEO4_200063 [Clostridium neonatale]CAI3603836.1 hypothetical protein CNEO3_260005 [Clostridium neonatale]CAI3645105.1 hypothetical protein CNEO2_340052 [Clostridium neonatale]
MLFIKRKLFIIEIILKVRNYTVALMIFYSLGNYIHGQSVDKLFKKYCNRLMHSS